jgi:hypothetical protein
MAAAQGKVHHPTPFFTHAPRPVAPAPPEPPKIRADRLNAAQKAVVWQHIQQHEPELHAFLVDPVILAFRKRQGNAVPVFDLAMVQTALAAAGMAL